MAKILFCITVIGCMLVFGSSAQNNNPFAQNTPSTPASSPPPPSGAAASPSQPPSKEEHPLPPNKDQPPNPPSSSGGSLPPTAGGASKPEGAGHEAEAPAATTIVPIITGNNGVHEHGGLLSETTLPTATSTDKHAGGHGHSHATTFVISTSLLFVVAAPLIC